MAARPQPRAVKQGAVTNHVIVISIDGLRPDAIEKFDAKTLRRLMAEGSYSLEAQTIFPSKTLPSHTSMLTGVPPEVHGITWNNDQVGKRGVVPVPTVFEIAHEQGYGTAAFFSKEKFHHLEKMGTLDHAQAPEGTAWMATRTVADVSSYLKYERPSLLFVHIGETDYAGHAVGWMSFAYGWAVRRADAAVESILRSADATLGRGNYTVIITADHGGHGRDHGSADPRDMTIPWITWGKGVEPGSPLGSIRTMDTAATVLWLLGANEPSNWVGRPVAGAFTPDAQAAAALAD
jgi:predicted AlkP superfamily pyrophosphatase or phosphodiesterase